MRYLLDTTVLIDHSRGQAGATFEIQGIPVIGYT